VAALAVSAVVGAVAADPAGAAALDPMPVSAGAAPVAGCSDAGVLVMPTVSVRAPRSPPPPQAASSRSAPTRDVAAIVPPK
jgi:hypothetical protein